MRVPLWMMFLGFSAMVGLGSSFYLVYLSNHSPFGLVREDYYDAGVHLDAQRQREAGFDSLKLDLTLRETADSLILETREDKAPSSFSSDFSQTRSNRSYQVLLELQRPDDPSADRKLDLSSGSAPVGEAPRWAVATPPLRKGQWNCRLVFEELGRPVLENSFAYYAGD